MQGCEGSADSFEANHIINTVNHFSAFIALTIHQLKSSSKISHSKRTIVTYTSETIVACRVLTR